MYFIKYAIIASIVTTINIFGQEKQNLKYEYKLELSIGENSEDAKSELGSPHELVVDKEGNIFVIELTNKTIKKFDKNGKFKTSFGKEGKGPGEFLFPMSIGISGKNQLYVYDFHQNQVSFFELNGKFINSVKLTIMLPWPTGFKIINDNIYLWGMEFGSESGNKAVLVKFNNSGKFEKYIFNGNLPSSEDKITDYPQFLFNDEKCFYLFSSVRKQKFLIEKYNFKGELVKSITKPGGAIKFSAKEFQKIKENADLANKRSRVGVYTPSEFKNQVTSAYLDENDFLFAVVGLRNQDGNGFDIFNTKGELVGSIPKAPSGKAFMGNEKIYQIEEDSETGLSVIRVYKFTAGI